MRAIDKWLDRIYEESDFGRAFATSAAGVFGLVWYFLSEDWVIAAFSTIISFPMFRLAASALYQRYKLRSDTLLAGEQGRLLFAKLSGEEKAVVDAFVNAGGCVLTWTQINELGVSMTAIESLLSRELLWPSTTADAMRETFVLDAVLFDAGQSRRCNQ